MGRRRQRPLQGSAPQTARQPWLTARTFVSSILVALMSLSSGVYFVAGWQALQISAPLRVEGVILGLMHSIRLGRLYAADALANPPYSVLDPYAA